MKRSVVIAIIIATAIKLAVAWLTFGTSDVTTYRAFADNVSRCGGCAYYIPGPFGDPFNHPPFIVHFLKLLALAGPSAFPFLFRLPSIIADIGTVLVVSRMFRSASTPLLIALAMNPVSILVSSFHGNTDPIMIFFLVLAVYLISSDKPRLAAIAFGMALNIKAVPLLFVPALFFYMRSWRQRIVFFSIVAAVVVIASLPYLLNDPLVIAKSVLGYTGMYGKWGTSRLMVAAGLSKNGHNIADMFFRYAIVLLSVTLSIWMNRKRVDLFYQVGFIAFIFFALSGSVSTQYLIWPVPFVIAAGLWWASAYYLSAGAHLFLTYNYWSHGHWYYADSHIEPQWLVADHMAGILCWGICCLLCIRYKQLISRRSRDSLPGPSNTLTFRPDCL